MAKNLYKYYVANLRSLEVAIKSTALSARRAISEDNSNSVQSFIRLYAFLVGAWAETRLGKLLLEESGFSSTDRKLILGESTQLDQWFRTVEMAFRKHFHVARAELQPPNISHTHSFRYLTLREIIDVQLRPIICIRNKLAHGQWIYPLNSDASDVEKEKYTMINKENLLSLQFKYSVVRTIAEIINDLVVSHPTFDRDFDNRFGLMTNTLNNLKSRSYDKYKVSMIAKHRRGIVKRKGKS